MLKTDLPYNQSEDLLLKVEKAYEYCVEDEGTPMNLMKDFEAMHNIADHFISIDIELDDFSSRDGRPNRIDEDIRMSRPFFNAAFGEIETAMRKILGQFESFFVISNNENTD